MSSERRGSESVTNLAGNFSQCSAFTGGNARHISESLVRSVQPKPALFRKAELSSSYTEPKEPLGSLNMDALNGLFDVIQQGLALRRVFVLRVVVHIS